MDEPTYLIREAQKGSRRAFGELIRHYQSRIRASLARFIKDRSVVDDLAQETFLSAFRVIGDYRGDSTPGVWLLGIARNKALMYLREQSRRRTQAGELLRSALAGWSARKLEREDAASDPAPALGALQTCLKSLSGEGARVVQEFYFEGRTVVDIARRSGKKESAVGMTLHRLRSALRQCVQERLSASEA